MRPPERLIPDREALLRRVVEADLVGKVSPVALQSYYAGRRVVARHLLEHRRPAGPLPSAVRAMLDDETLWVDPPPPAHPGGAVEDHPRWTVAGHAVRTVWSTFLGVRVQPRQNLLVGTPEDAPAGAKVPLGEIPLTAAQRRTGSVRRAGAFAAVCVAGAVLVVGALAVAPRRVVAYNGYPVKIHVRIGDEDVLLHAGAAERRWSWAPSLHLSATGPDGLPIDEREVQTWGKPSMATLLYVPGGQAVPAVYDVVYGSGTPRDTVYLPREALQLVSADYVFEAPPRTMSVDRGSVKHVTELQDARVEEGSGTPVSAIFVAAHVYGYPEAAAMGIESLRVAPDQYDRARLLQWSSGASALDWWADLHARAPASLPTWRRYAQLTPDRAAALEEALAAAAGGSVEAAVVAAELTADAPEAVRIARGVVDQLQAPSEAADHRAAARAAVLGAAAREVYADALGRAGAWEEAVAAWAAYAREEQHDPWTARSEQARAARHAGLAPTTEGRVPLPDDDAGLSDATDAVAAAPSTLAAALAAVEDGEDAAAGRLQLAIAARDVEAARRLVNEAKGVEDAGTQLEWALRVELAGAGDPTGLAVRLREATSLSPRWTLVAAAAAQALGLASAPDWAREADADPDGGPFLADVRAVAAAGPRAGVWAAWAPRHHVAASLAAAWLCAEDAARRDAWLAEADAAALPGEVLVVRGARR